MSNTSDSSNLHLETNTIHLRFIEIKFASQID